MYVCMYGINGERNSDRDRERKRAEESAIKRRINQLKKRERLSSAFARALFSLSASSRTLSFVRQTLVEKTHTYTNTLHKYKYEYEYEFEFELSSNWLKCSNRKC